jgi:VanZ family protein
MAQMKKISLGRWTWGTLWVAYAILIFYLSSQPFPEASPIMQIPFGDKWTHLVEYMLFGWLTLKALEPKTRRDWVLALALALVYAASDEVHQIFVPTRSASLLDWSADGIGIGVSALVYGWLARKNP